MKHILSYINEAIVKRSVVAKEYKFIPITKEELISLINERIKMRGAECDLNDISVEKITDMSYLFAYEETHNFNGNISGWDVRKVTDMSHMFYNSAYTGKKGGIANWNTMNVKNMSGMFEGSKFNSDISLWDVYDVKIMARMFACSPFNQDISRWKVKNVEDMTEMFKESDFEQDLSDWEINMNVKYKGIFSDSKLMDWPEWYYMLRYK